MYSKVIQFYTHTNTHIYNIRIIFNCRLLKILNIVPCVCVYVLVTQLCLTLCDPTDYSPLGFSVHGILQARILEWIAIPISRGSSKPRDWTLVSCITSRVFTIWVTGKSWSESRSVVSDSATHGLYSSLDSPGQNTGVGSLSLLQGIFPT